ncbi:MAG: VOC family protein [Planctomycetaceae bacterium]|nr:VOC family protein [Planctomycetaceae bacterium]
MSTAAADLVKFHLSLNASSLANSVAFYRTLFGVEPAKVRDDYAKFELAEPPVVLSLIPIPPRSGGPLNHAGLRLLDSAALVAVQHRLELAGYATQREEGVECCYSKQTKFWVHDPDGCLWEIYVLHGDVDEHDHESASHERGLVGNSAFRGRVQGLAVQIAAATSNVPQPIVWQHILTQPLPARIDAADGSVDEVQLQGTLNRRDSAEAVRTFLADVKRALKAGGTISAHVLTADRPLSEKPTLPGPASLVEQVWTDTEIGEFFSAAGFVGLRFSKLSQKPCFTVGKAQLRETKLSGSKPGTADGDFCGPVEVLYKGPLRELRDDFGNVYPRGTRVRINGAAAKLLAELPQAAETFLFSDGNDPSGCCG